MKRTLLHGVKGQVFVAGMEKGPLARCFYGQNPPKTANPSEMTRWRAGFTASGEPIFTGGPALTVQNDRESGASLLGAGETTNQKRAACLPHRKVFADNYPTQAHNYSMVLF
ncbi:MAG: hypothetical protein P4K94_07385 [Terracidiphilus sp.]|nr:hypothetical protein [Terracidiphilus sp.]